MCLLDIGAFTRARLIGDRKVIGQNNGQDQNRDCKNRDKIRIAIAFLVHFKTKITVAQYLDLFATL